MAKAPPFKQRLETAIAAGKASGATHIRVNQDGSVELDFTEPQAPEVNDFDRPPNPLPAKGNGNTRT
jgi:hypothetical protein